MEVKQFYDKDLAHASYGIVSDGKVALVDPARNPEPYLQFAQEHRAKIVAVFETHPHADFVSSHLEFHEKHGATIYINSQMGVSYPHQTIDDGEEVTIGSVTFRALFTPGHSPDHNSYLLLDESGKTHSVFTGDSLFVGDVGRPDLREGAGHLRAKRKELAQQMFHTIRDVFRHLDDHITVYPAHGAGSLCGKNMGSETYSTIGQEKEQNWAFKIDEEEVFVKNLLEDQPFVPQYFAYDVELNRQGVAPLQETLSSISMASGEGISEDTLVVDVREEHLFKQGHAREALNIQEEGKFETWLGSLVAPEKPFYLVANDEGQGKRMAERAAKIGYETQIIAIVTHVQLFEEESPVLDLEHFRFHPEDYTIVDVRNAPEANDNPIFEDAVNIPLAELADRTSEINTEKPVVVHCAGGYRSAAGSSILEAALPETRVYDLSDEIKKFQTQEV